MIRRDEEEDDKPYGQKLRATFPLADVFFNTSDSQFEKSVETFVELLLEHPFHTPTREEFAMFLAHAGSLRSADLGQQVGATITTSCGEPIAIGTNEAPKAGGGQYWRGDNPDGRDFALKISSNDAFKKAILTEMLSRLRSKGWFVEAKKGTDGGVLASEAFEELKGSQFMDVIEYNRSVHAEMAALIDAARRGVSVRNCILYSTTFPCHECARHIVAAGITKVFYIHPYTKSRVATLYKDSIALDEPAESTEQGPKGKVLFVPFMGIAPRRYMDLYTAGERKRDGEPIVWDGKSERPRGIDPLSLTYLSKEELALNKLKDRMERVA